MARCLGLDSVCIATQALPTLRNGRVSIGCTGRRVPPWRRIFRFYCRRPVLLSRASTWRFQTLGGMFLYAPCLGAMSELSSGRGRGKKEGLQAVSYLTELAPWWSDGRLTAEPASPWPIYLLLSRTSYEVRRKARQRNGARVRGRQQSSRAPRQRRRQRQRRRLHFVAVQGR